MSADPTTFPAEVEAKLKTYVYRLIDPRNGETFYVGKGTGDRVFAHTRERIDGDDPNDRMQRIREIRRAGFEVAHVIHRHGMDERTAFEVEAALMDAYPGLTNVVDGVGNANHGAMHAKEVIRRYAAEPAVFEHQVLMLNVNQNATEMSLYEAVRYAWNVDVQRAGNAEVVLATAKGMIVGAFVADRWVPATAKNFPGRETIPGKHGFVGHEASEEVARLYVGKRVPDEYRKRGAANPLRYSQSEPGLAGN